MMKESRKRSVLKTISWRATATLTTMIISFFITGQIEWALKIGAFEVVAKLLLGYYHERIWQMISFGYKSQDYSI